jgi:SAM-dependent methyltransferase
LARRIAAAYARLRRGIRLWGVKGTARQAWQMARGWREQRRWAAQDREFDERHGVDTAGIVPLHALAIDSPNTELGVRYQASAPERFRALLGSIEIPGGATFVDVGTGKGRPLLLASEWPFRRIVGVEFSPELCAVAERNAARFRSDAQRCRDIEVVCADATTWELPDEPLVVYLYNPFEPPLMREVLGGIRRSVERSPRELLLILVNVGDRSLALEAGFRLLHAHEFGDVYVPAPAAAPASPTAPAAARRA